MNNKKLRNYNLIGISGHKESGKDLVARIIQYLKYREENPDFSTDSISSTNLSNYFQYGFCLFPTNGEECINIIEESGLENRKFADKVKDIVCLLIGCTREQLEDRDFKENYYFVFNKKIRFVNCSYINNSHFSSLNILLNIIKNCLIKNKDNLSLFKL